MARLITEVKLALQGGSRTIGFGAGPITILVGPNNSGKTTLLREIHTYLQNPSAQRQFRLLQAISLFEPSRETWFSRMQEIGVQVGEGQHGAERFARTLRLPVLGRVDYGEQLRSGAYSFTNAQIRNTWLAAQTAYIDADNRTGILPQGPLNLAERGAQSLIGRLFANDQLREQVRAIVHRAFQKFLVIDPRDTNNAFLRLSGTAPDSSRERSLDEANLNYLDQADMVSSLSHGVRSFVSQVCFMFEPRLKLIVVDEPEISLSQPLAYALGEELAKLSAQNDVQVFAATHSEAFLMGCVSSGQSVEILRLSRDSMGTANAMCVSPSDLRPLFRKPLLRSSQTVSALFHNAAVVTEGDPDRAFYEEVNRRLKGKGARHIRDAAFLRAQNKQTVYEVLGPLRKFGVPTAAIVDVDVFKEGGENWTRILDAIEVPPPLRQSFESPRMEIAREIRRLTDSGTDPKRMGGIACFDAPIRETAEDLIARLAERGFFVVAGGELESWLKTLEATGHGPSWLVNVFTKMGDDPSAEGFVGPDQVLTDVWEFVAKIADWCANPARLGMPQ